MDEYNAKTNTECSSYSHTSSSDAISRNFKDIDPFTFVEVKCEIEVSTLIKLLISVHFN
jgi:hypothetical protein